MIGGPLLLENWPLLTVSLQMNLLLPTNLYEPSYDWAHYMKLCFTGTDMGINASKRIKCLKLHGAFVSDMFQTPRDSMSEVYVLHRY